MNIYRLARPVCLMSRCGSMFPFSIRYNADNEMTDTYISKFDVIRCASVIIAFVAIFLNAMIVRPSNESSKEMFLFLMLTLQMKISIWIGIFCVCMNFIQREKLLLTLQQIDSFDRKIVFHGVNVNFAKHKRFVNGIYAVIFAEVVVFEAIEISTGSHSSMLMKAACICQHYIFSNAMSIYLFLLLSLRHRYMLLNQIIRFAGKLLLNSVKSTSIRAVFLGRNFSNVCQRLNQAHARNSIQPILCDVCEKCTITLVKCWVQWIALCPFRCDWNDESDE